MGFDGSSGASARSARFGTPSAPGVYRHANPTGRLLVPRCLDALGHHRRHVAAAVDERENVPVGLPPAIGTGGAGPAAAERPCARRPSEGSRRIRAMSFPPAEAPGQGQATADFTETSHLAGPSSFAVSHGTLKRLPHHSLHPSVSPDPAGCPRRPPRLPALPVDQTPFPVPTPS